MKKLEFLAGALCVIMVILVTVLSIRGLAGNPTTDDLLTDRWREGGPFELSPERGRFALLYSLVEDNSFFFSLPIAKFVVPDLGYKDGRYVSLFAPTVSFLVAPGYIIGKYFGYSQLGTFAVVSIFGLLNLLLVRKLSLKLGANSFAAWLAGFVFLFATPAFAYSVNLYQHHFSTFVILVSIWILTTPLSLLRSLIFWFLIALSVSIDNPNAFMVAPLVVYHLFQLAGISLNSERLKISLKIKHIIAVVGIVAPLVFFGWFNYQSYGNPLQLGGTVRSVKAIDANGLPTNPDEVKVVTNPKGEIENLIKKKSAVGFFKTRQILNGLFIHTISPDRGVVYFTPIILLGIVGFFFLRGQVDSFGPLLAGVVGANLLLYSMWGDPWGGWAFGSRYLIPSYAILAITLGVALTHLRRHLVFLILFLPLLYHSLFVNTMGALTTSRIPPKAEVLELERLSGMVQKYSYDRTYDYLKDSRLKSFAYNSFFKQNLTGLQYHQLLVCTIFAVCVILLLSSALRKDRA